MYIGKLCGPVKETRAVERSIPGGGTAEWHERLLCIHRKNRIQ